MKKILLYITLFVLLFSLTACGGDKTRKKSTSLSNPNAKQPAITNTEKIDSSEESLETYKNESETDKKTSSIDSTSTKETDSTTVSTDNSATSDTAWSEGQRLPDMPIE